MSGSTTVAIHTDRDVHPGRVMASPIYQPATVCGIRGQSRSNRICGNPTSHVPFISVPASGHVYPALPLVQEITRRGHQAGAAVVGPRHVMFEADGALGIGW